MEKVDFKKKAFADLTPEDIQDLKARHGDNLQVVTLKNKRKVEVDPSAEGSLPDGADEPDNAEVRFIIKTPTRTVMDAVGQHGVSKNITAANKVLINNCVLAGDMGEIEEDGGVYTALLDELRKLVRKKEASVKKL